MYEKKLKRFVMREPVKKISIKNHKRRKKLDALLKKKVMGK